LECEKKIREMWPSGVIVPYKISCSGLRIAAKMWAGGFLW